MEPMFLPANRIRLVLKALPGERRSERRSNFVFTFSRAAEVLSNHSYSSRHGPQNLSEDIGSLISEEVRMKTYYIFSGEF